MSLQSEQLENRTTTFAVAALALIDELPRTAAGEVVAKQLAR